MGVGYSFSLSETSSLAVNANIKRYQFKNFPTVTISNNNPTAFAFDVSFERQLHNQFSLQAKAGALEILTLRPKSSTQIDLSQLLAPVVGIAAIYSMGDRTRWFRAFDVNASVDVLLPAKGNGYTSSVGHKEQIKLLTVKNSTNGSLISGGITAYQQKFETPFSKTTQLGFGFEFSIGLEAAPKKRPEKDLESEGIK